MAGVPYWPVEQTHSVGEADTEAVRIRQELDWHLGAFVAVFDDSLNRVLLVQLGNYAKLRAGGNPWTLPGGSAELGELPSEAALRELREETGLDVELSNLQFAAWFARPYYQPTGRDHPGEVVLVFAAKVDPASHSPRPSPPEILSTAFVFFSLEEWLAVPSLGGGAHPLQPLRRHWIYWTALARESLLNPPKPPHIWTYPTSESMQSPPWGSYLGHHLTEY